MRISAVSLLYALPLLLCVEAAQAAENTIHMLPPVPFGSVGANPPPCATGSTSGMLFWGGVDGSGSGEPINCVPGFTGNSSGDITVAGTANFAGNVGIAAPSQVAGSVLKLYVGGAIGSSDGGFFTYDYATASDAGKYGAFYRSNGVNYLWDSTYGNVLQYNSSGQVGIGVSPAYALDVKTDIGIDGQDVIRRGGTEAFLFPYGTGYSNKTVYVGSYGYSTDMAVIGQFQINGSSWLDTDAANTVVGVRNAPVCSANQALTKTGDAQFACVAVTDIQNVGTTALPNCAGNGTFLTSNGNSFSCQAQTQPQMPRTYWDINDGTVLYNTGGASVAIGLTYTTYQLDVNTDIAVSGTDVLRRDGYNSFIYPNGTGYTRTVNGSTRGTPVYVGGSTLTDMRVTGLLGTANFDPIVGIPSGWVGGLHTWDVYAEGSVGVGPTGGPATAYMNNAGTVAGTDYCINGNCNRTPVQKGSSCNTGQYVTGFDSNGSPVCSGSSVPDCSGLGYTVLSNNGDGLFCNVICPGSTGLVGDDGFYSDGNQTYYYTYPNGKLGEVVPHGGVNTMFLGSDSCSETEYMLQCTLTGWIQVGTTEALACQPPPQYSDVGGL